MVLHLSYIIELKIAKCIIKINIHLKIKKLNINNVKKSSLELKQIAKGYILAASNAEKREILSKKESKVKPKKETKVITKIETKLITKTITIKK